ncbi:MAG: type IV secretion system DNA-binding domain-containing protein [Candidatus Yanofskybacteria bacterium]|nr:type IV secretion system DNA-binding domain-containing protein [Candidatus Yanofskybacteria bacterium]
MTQGPDNQVVLFGKTEFRNSVTNFGIKLDDRRRHMYIIGKSGMGKSELLKNLAIQDIQDGRGLCFMDPHGDPVYDLLDYIPADRVKDVIFINPADMQYPIGFNVMEQVGFDQRHLVADGMMAVFKKIWVDAWSARMEYILNNTILALLEAPGSTLIGINRMLADKDYRRQVVNQITDPEVKAFWIQEFAKYTDKFASEATAAIQNKIGQFVSNPLIRNLIGQPTSSFNMREAMDQKKIILVDISKGRIGEDASRLLGAMIITKIQLAAMSRVDIPRHERADFTLIVDEFQNFATASFANILSEARKFNLSLIVAHQYIKQLDEAVADAVFGNVGTIISFRVGAEDAEVLEKEFAPEFMATDIVNLGFRQMYLKLMIDGVTSHAFSAMTMDTLPKLAQTTRDEVIEYSRSVYARPRAQVEADIAAWRAPIEEAPREDRPMRKPAPFPSEDRASGRAAQPPHREDRSRPSGPQGQRRDDRGRKTDDRQRIPRQERSSSQQGASLGDLFKGAVDFRGKKIEAQSPEPEESPVAEGASASFVSSEDRDLKALIAEALGK